MILRFNFKKKRFPILPFLFLLFSAMILMAGFTVREDLIRIGKSLAKTKVVVGSEAKKPGSREKRKVDERSLTVEPSGQITLCGILFVGEQRYVYLKSTGEEKFILREGEYCGKFNLESVSPDSVVLIWNSGKREVLHW